LREKANATSKALAVSINSTSNNRSDGFWHSHSKYYDLERVIRFPLIPLPIIEAITLMEKMYHQETYVSINSTSNNRSDSPLQ